MKVLIPILIGLLVLGCGKGGEITIGEPPKAKPVKELTLREKVVGSYEFSPTSKIVFLDNGVLELYQNNEIAQSNKWSIVDEEIHILNQDGEVEVVRIEPNGDLTNIAKIKNGIRTEESLDEQQTIKRIK